jgi:hypothetical protein
MLHMVWPAAEISAVLTGPGRNVRWGRIDALPRVAYPDFMSEMSGDEQAENIASPAAARPTADVLTLLLRVILIFRFNIDRKKNPTARMPHTTPYPKNLPESPPSPQQRIRDCTVNFPICRVGWSGYLQVDFSLGPGSSLIIVSGSLSCPLAWTAPECAREHPAALLPRRLAGASPSC